jgi:5-methylcytosine-specific restriction enzyme subunit McrC
MTAWTTEHVVLTHTEAAQLARSGLVEVSAEPQSDEWRLRSSSLVGIAVGDGWELRVRPRIDVQKLMFLLGYARDPSGWGRDQSDFAHDPELFDAVAHAFAHQASIAIERGTLRGYVHPHRQVDDPTRSPPLRKANPPGRRSADPGRLRLRRLHSRHPRESATKDRRNTVASSSEGSFADSDPPSGRSGRIE